MGKITRRGSLALTAALAVVLAGTTSASAAGSIDRLSGEDRFGTAIDVSKQADTAAKAANYVIIARSSDYPDALAAAPLAEVLGGAPILLNENDKGLREDVLKEIQRLKALKGGTLNAVIVGGTGAISAQAETDLKLELGKDAGGEYRVSRIAGSDRYETAVNIAAAVETGNLDSDAAIEAPNPFGPNLPVFVADGLGFADALAAGPAAVKAKGAIVLSRGTGFDSYTETVLGQTETRSQTRDYLLDVTASQTVYAVGGPAAAAVGGQVKADNKLVGIDRFETATKVAGKFFPSPTVVGLANGLDYPDAIVAGAYLGADGPLLLTRANELPGVTATYLKDKVAANVTATIFGGKGVVADSVSTSISDAIGQFKVQAQFGLTGSGDEQVLTVTALPASSVTVQTANGLVDIFKGVTDSKGIVTTTLEAGDSDPTTLTDADEGAKFLVTVKNGDTTSTVYAVVNTTPTAPSALAVDGTVTSQVNGTIAAGTAKVNVYKKDGTFLGSKTVAATDTTFKFDLKGVAPAANHAAGDLVLRAADAKGNLSATVNVPVIVVPAA
ncbi:cell wall-binding repeat-containing protein [Georgenia ruanii]|nr:cell wall-binding repeat-containing protein [Georgenia ruanii]MPV87640.1 hypothetical protein [Georgenia ruanii]